MKHAFSHFAHHLKLLLKSNSFWLVVFTLLWTAATSLDAQFLATYPNVRAWILPSGCVLAVIVKMIQNQIDLESKKANK
jgi:hypothetical protein